MKIRSAGSTHVGRVRTSNEDYYGVFDDLDLYVVADGMGGHAAGEVASSMAVQTIRNAFAEAGAERTLPADGAYDPGRRLVWAIEQANEKIFNAGSDNPALSGMGTTVVAVWVGDEAAYIAHVGDSRVYLVHAGGITQVTSDHSLVNDYLSRGIMTPAEAAVHPMKHVLIRALGTASGVAVDIQRVPLQPGDILLLCSDGLSNIVPADELSAILSKTTKDDLPTRCQELIDAANRRGGLDNITAVLVRADTSC
ncbi:MAG: Stp1/IreP family PP2C-type Ser/Thr phosphatase [Nitrospirota bacterium]